MNETPETDAAAGDLTGILLGAAFETKCRQLEMERNALRDALQQNQNMNDTPETQAAFLLFDTGEQGLHYVSEQMRKIERERDQLKQWTSVNGVLELERERDRYQAAMWRYLEAYQKEEAKNQELEKKLEAFN